MPDTPYPAFPALRPQSDRPIHGLWTFIAVTAIFCFGVAGPVSAHTYAQRIPAPDAIEIHGLTHGQMQIVAANRKAIVAIADAQTVNDPTFWKLRNFMDTQYAACFWGLVPGSVRDENSPFNECSHAYLSAAAALLLYMQTVPSAADAVRELKSRIVMQMITSGTAAILCRYSDEPFYTSDLITPHWEDAASHLPTLASGVGLGTILAGAGFSVVRLTRRVSGSGKSG